MDRLKRKILYNKQSETTAEPENKPAKSKWKPKIPPAPVLKPATATSVVKWIKEHKYFKYALMCSDIGVDKANFKRVLESDNPKISEKQLTEIIKVIKSYGYAE